MLTNYKHVTFAQPGKIAGLGIGRIRAEDLTPQVIDMLLRNGLPEHEFIRLKPMYSLVDISTKETLYVGHERPQVYVGYVKIGNEKHYQFSGRSMAVYPISEMRVPVAGENFDHFMKQSRGVGSRAVVSSKVMDFGEGYEHPDKEIVKLKVWQIYFNDDSERQLDSVLTPFYNETADKYLESSVIKRVWEMGEWRGHAFTGVVSYGFTRKTGKSAAGAATIMATDDCKHDAYGFQSLGLHPTPHLVWNVMNNSHPHGSRLAQEILVRRLGFDERVLKTEYNNAYANMYIYKAHVFDAYVKHCLLPVMQAMDDETDTEIQRLVNSNSMYFKNSRMSSDWMRRTFGYPYYTYHPFFCERLPGMFLKEFGYTHKLVI